MDSPHQPLPPIGANRCKSCPRDFRFLRTAYCQRCETVFSADFKTIFDDPEVDCPLCGTTVDPQFVKQDVPEEFCKHCRGGDSSSDSRKPATVQVRKSSPEKPPMPRSSSEKRNDSPKTRASSGAQHNLDELWRCIGCICGNKDPDKFSLEDAQWPKNSYFCRDCRLPYSSFCWDTELRRDQCPRCNGDNVVTDKVAKGEVMIVCQGCTGMVSKGRYDAVCKEVQSEEEEAARRQSQLQQDNLTCGQCGSSDVKLTVVECDDDEGNSYVLQVCSTCKLERVLAAWDRRADRIGVAVELGDEAAEPSRVRRVPDGFEELVKCCGDLGCLHPVADDPKDELLVCGKCGRVINLMACRDKRIPVTVSSLRRALKGTFSSGEMGRPYRTKKVESLAELRPGDQLDFKKPMYSHHAIVKKPVPEKDQLSVIEYTGESNRPTIVALLQVLPNKARVQKSRLTFSQKRQYMHRVDYYSLDCYEPRAVLSRAKEWIGKEEYNLFTANCEHFSNWAKANANFSRQVEKVKETARDMLRGAVVEISEFIDGVPQSGSTRAAVTILQDIRGEMLGVLEKNSAGAKDFWCPIGLVLKWAIRGFPLIFSKVFSKTTGCKILWKLDGVLKPLSDKAANALLPKLAIEDVDEKEKGEKKATGGRASH